MVNLPRMRILLLKPPLSNRRSATEYVCVAYIASFCVFTTCMHRMHTRNVRVQTLSFLECTVYGKLPLQFVVCHVHTHTHIIIMHMYITCHHVSMFRCDQDQRSLLRKNNLLQKYVLVIRPHPWYSFSVHFILWHVDPLLWCHPFGALHSVEIIPFFGACSTVACSIDPLLWCHPSFGALHSVEIVPFFGVCRLWHAV